MRIFHIAMRSDWNDARRSGSYTMSTISRTLAEEGFIHASRGDQWQRVRDTYYADIPDPLVLLVIDTDRLTAPVVEEVPAGGIDETFPHIYGPINADAVVQTVSIDAPGQQHGESFSALFLGEMFRNLLLGSLLIGLVAFAVVVGRIVDPEWGALVGLGIALLVGIPLVVLLHRRVSR